VISENVTKRHVGRRSCAYACVVMAAKLVLSHQFRVFPTNLTTRRT